MAADVTTPPPTVDSHDPLPEGNWFWRRVFVFALCTVVTIGTWFVIQAMINLSGNNADLTVKALTKIVAWMLLLSWFAMTYYIVGTNAEQVVKIVQTAGLFKSGIASTLTQTAIGPDGSRAVASTTTGPVVVPPVAPSALQPPSTNTELLGNVGSYTGPPLEDMPPPNPATPEDAPWKS